MPTKILDCTLDEYQRDEWGTWQERPPSLSQSIANVLLAQSPLHAWQASPRLGGGREREETPETELGTLLHAVVLGKGAEVAVLPFDDWRTKAAKEQRDAERVAGHLPVLEKKWDIAQAIGSRISGKLIDRGIVLDGQSEVKIAWEEDVDTTALGRMVPGASGLLVDSPVQCKGMLDHLKIHNAHGPSATAYDLKTTQSAHPGACARKVADLGYHVQGAAYVSGVEHLYPSLVGRVDFVLIFAEVRAPFEITVARLGGVFKQLGEERWKRAVSTWSRCLLIDEWPGYSDEIISLEAPPWIVNQLEAEAYGERVE